MSLPVRITALLVAFAAVVVGAAFIVVHYILGSPPTVSFNASSGGVTNVVLQEDPQNDSASKPDWVSYFVQDPNSKAWVHTTLFSVPKGMVHVTILGYDGCTPLRNNFWSQVQGTVGGTVKYSVVNNKGVATPTRSVSVIDSWAGCTVGHTFAIPALHLFVPVASPNALDSANNLCGSSPCTSGPHSVMSFSFRVPNSGTFRWQCLVPCGGGFLDGNGGPMQTIGYMTGNMEVRA